jgi:hypothetical protein
MQVQVFKHLRHLMRENNYRFMALHIPNGGRRTRFEAFKLIEMGVMAGAADILLLFPPGPGCEYGRAVFVEMKATDPPPAVRLKKDGTPVKARARNPAAGQQESQKIFEARVKAIGFDYWILSAAGQSEAVAKIYGILRHYGVKA